jgi:hypothetical protein
MAVISNVGTQPQIALTFPPSAVVEAIRFKKSTPSAIRGFYFHHLQRFCFFPVFKWRLMCIRWQSMVMMNGKHCGKLLLGKGIV